MIHEEEIEDTPCLDTTFHDIERSATAITSWDRWAARAKKLAGLTSLDGDECEGADGYSLDGAYEAFEAGVSAKDYVAGIPARREARLRLGYDEYIKSDIYHYRGLLA